MADYTYEKLNEQIKTDESLMEEYGKYSDPVSRDVYSQAKNRLAENQPLLDEYATAWKDQQQKLQEQKEQTATKEISDKISDLEQENKLLSQQLDIANGCVFFISN